MNTGRVIVAFVGVVVIVAAGSFVASPDASTEEAVDFDDTVSIGLTSEERRVLEDRDLLIPRAQVHYSQYTYVVGYRGIGLAAEEIDDPLVRQQFGYPQTVLVEVVPADVELDEGGFIHGRHTNRWIPAGEAFFVVGSGARIPGANATLAFEDRSAAERFADGHDGRVVEWDDRDLFEAPTADGEKARDRIDERHAEADATVEEAFEHLDRPEELVVGEDASTLEEALEIAPSNATIRLPPGRYEGPVTISESVTIRGEGATIRGNGTGSVVTVTAPDVAIAGVSIDGVGDVHRPEDVDSDEWDAHTELAYGHADAGITIAEGDRALVSDVEIDTPAAGVAVRDSNGTVIDGIEVHGDDHWDEGFMGVVTMRSPLVVQNSTFYDGRDGIYTHRAHGSVVRHNHFDGGRFGIHLMYTSETLLAGNCHYGQGSAGIVIMTSPSGTAIHDNVLLDAGQGILTSGSNAYVGENLVVAGRQGISTNARDSLYTNNVVLGNDVGFRAASIVPTSRVLDNDVVDNDEQVQVGTGPLRVWTHDGAGNYWSGAEDLDRAYTPSGPIDGQLHRTPAAETLAASPVAYGLRQLQTAAPGMRTGSVVDAAPRSTPANPERVDAGGALMDGHETNGTFECPIHRTHE